MNPNLLFGKRTPPPVGGSVDPANTPNGVRVFSERLASGREVATGFQDLGRPVPGGLGNIAPSGVARDRKRLVIALAAGQNKSITVSGEFIYVESVESSTLIPSAAPAFPVTVTPDTLGIAFNLDANAKHHPGVKFDNLVFSNAANTTAVVVTVIVGFGDYFPAILRVGPNRWNFTSASNATNGAYAAGQVVGATQSIAGFFPLNFNYAEIRRVRLAFNNNVTALGSFRLWLVTADNGFAPAVDKAALNITYSDLPQTAAPIDLPSLISGGATWAICDVSGLAVPVVKGSASTSGLERTIYPVFEARAAYNPGAAISTRLDITADFF